MFDWLKTSWWKSNLFLSSLFGSALATGYVFILFALNNRLKYTGFVDFLDKLLPSILPLWTLLFVFVMFLYVLTKKPIFKAVSFLGFSDKSFVGLCTLIYVVGGAILVGIAKLLSFELFNSFAVVSTFIVGMVFTNSMDFSLNKMKDMEK